jgi:hypothetical protein
VGYLQRERDKRLDSIEGRSRIPQAQLVYSQSRGPVRQCTIEKGPQELHTTDSKVTPGDTHGAKTPPALEIVNPLRTKRLTWINGRSGIQEPTLDLRPSREKSGANQKCRPSPYPPKRPRPCHVIPETPSASPARQFIPQQPPPETNTPDAQKICLPLLRFSPTILPKTQHGCCKA